MANFMLPPPVCPISAGHYSTFSTASHAHFLSTNRTAVQHLKSIDKVVYHQATQGLTQAQRSHLLAIQSLGIWDNAKQLEFFS